MTARFMSFLVKSVCLTVDAPESDVENDRGINQRGLEQINSIYSVNKSLFSYLFFLILGEEG